MLLSQLILMYYLKWKKLSVRTTAVQYSTATGYDEAEPDQPLYDDVQEIPPAPEPAEAIYDQATDDEVCVYT